MFFMFLHRTYKEGQPEPVIEYIDLL
ncbi:hypothetical protein WH5701_14146 [Synechococcus sp. WH 5701]|nr:hypothetical protein WH5701_14146 [Synechococcus sp. WH 5701]